MGADSSASQTRSVIAPIILTMHRTDSVAGDYSAQTTSTASLALMARPCGADAPFGPTACRPLIRDDIDENGAVLAAINSIPNSSSWTGAALASLDSSVWRHSHVIVDSAGSVLAFSLVHGVDCLNHFLYKGSSLLLRRLFVYPDVRNQGLGRHVLDAALRASEISRAALAWQTSKANHHANAWFRRHEIQPMGEISRGTHWDWIYHIQPSEREEI